MQNQKMTAVGVAQVTAENRHHFMEPLINIHMVLILHSLTLAVNNIKL